MNRYQAILTILACALVVVLYNLPRRIIIKEPETAADITLSVSEKDAETVKELRKSLQNESEFSVNFADSLARLYLKIGFLDSAANVMTFALARDSSLNTLSLAANIYYSAYERSQTSDDLQRLRQLAKMTLEKSLAKDESNLSLMCKLAMIEVNSDNPMTGIMKLRQVLEIDPTYREAVMDLGILAMKSGQWERAKVRFQQQLGQDANDQEARLNLGVCYMESGQDSLAIEMLGDVAADEYADPALVAAAQEYLKVLNN